MYIEEEEEGENRDEFGPLYSPETYTSDRLGSPQSELPLSPLWNLKPVDICVMWNLKVRPCVYKFILWLNDSLSSYNPSLLWNWYHHDICLDLKEIIEITLRIINVQTVLNEEMFNILSLLKRPSLLIDLPGIIIDVDETSSAGDTLANILKSMNDFPNVLEDPSFLALKRRAYIKMNVIISMVQEIQSIQEFNSSNCSRKLQNHYEFPEKTTAGAVRMNKTEQVNRLDEVQQNDMLPLVDASESRAGEGQHNVPSICCESMKKKRMPVEQRIELITIVPQAQEEGHSDNSHITTIVPCATITHLWKFGSASHDAGTDAEIPNPKETSLDVCLSIEGLTEENKDQQVGQPNFESSISSKSKNDRSTRKSQRTLTNKKGETVCIDEVKRFYGLPLDDASAALNVSRSTLKRFLRKHGINRWPSPANKRRKRADSSVEHKNNKDSRATKKIKGACPPSGGLVAGLASGSGVIHYKQQDKIPSQDHAVEGLDTVKSSHPIGDKHVVEIQNVESDFARDQVQDVVAENSVKNMIVKARYKDDFIKFLLPTSSNFEYLQGEVIKRLKLKVGTFSIKYMDDDKDWILTTCDHDLRLAVDSCLLVNATVIHMFIQQISSY